MGLLLGLLAAGAILFLFWPHSNRPLAEPVSASLAPPESAQTEAEIPLHESASSEKQALPSQPDSSQLKPEDQKKLETLQEILGSKNDNDPRLDGELRHLSPELKKAFEDYYQSLAPEKRNERGTIAFLIARDWQNADDANFLRSIFREDPCLSMADCQVLSPKDPHMSFADEVSLNYPQMATLFQLEKRLATNSGGLRDSNKLRQIRAVLDQAIKFGVPKVQKKAEEIQERFHL